MDESRMKALVVRFLAQVEEVAPRIARAIVELERGGTAEDVLRGGFDAMARDIHGLKGTAAMLGLAEVAELAHATEEVVRSHRSGGRAFGPRVADQMLEASDAFVSLVRARTAGEPGEDTRGLVASLKEAAAAADTVATPSRRDVAPAPGAQQAPAGDGAWRVDSRRVEALVRAVEGVREIFRRVDEHARELGGISSAHGAGVDPQTRARLRELGRALAFTSREAADVAETLEEDVKGLATVPLHTILEPMHRAVRDLCRKHEKEAWLSVVGGEHSLDRAMLDAMERMLTHLVRNAIDHGLEAPDERERAGKDRAGALVVRIEPQGNVVVLELSDDGSGIDVEAVRARAAKAGLGSEAELGELSPHQVMRLVFEDGLSTRDEATETSGRGIGLAAVRREAERLGGHIDLHSTAGQGTRFVVVLPVVLGSTPVLVVRSGEQLFGVPLLAVETVRQAYMSDLRATWDQVELLYNDELLPVHDLSVLLGLRDAMAPSEGQPLLVVGAPEGRAGILVDEVVGDRELSLRSLPVELRAIPAYQGVGMLALRDAVLVCRPSWLVESHRVAESATSRAPRALVVDDSLPVRAMHRTMLEAAGYVVHTASSGAQALERTSRARYDAVIADLAMEGIGGIALTRVLRTQPETRDVIVVVVTASNDPSDRDAAFVAGADDVLEKSDCAAGRLVEALERAGVRSRKAS